jgi:hypothetical protein
MTVFGLRPAVAMKPRLARSANTLHKGRWSPEGPSSSHPTCRRLRSRYSPPSLRTSGRNAPSGAAPLPPILPVNHGPPRLTDALDVVGRDASRSDTAPGPSPRRSIRGRSGQGAAWATISPWYDAETLRIGCPSLGLTRRGIAGDRPAGRRQDQGRSRRRETAWPVRRRKRADRPRRDRGDRDVPPGYPVFLNLSRGT